MGILKKANRMLAAVLATVLAAGVATASRARSDEPRLVLELDPPAELRVDDRAELVVRLHLLGTPAEPLLVTARSAGTAIDVVRGRFLRADGTALPDGGLAFRIPLVARTAGDGVVHIRVQSHACALRCVTLRTERSVMLRVERAAASRLNLKTVWRTAFTAGTGRPSL